jgi:hypothetical protein
MPVPGEYRLREDRYEFLPWVIGQWRMSASPYSDYHWVEIAAYPRKDWARLALIEVVGSDLVEHQWL